MDIKRRIFDANIFSAYRERLTEIDAGKTAFSLVVFYELTATKIYSSKRRHWEMVIGEHYENETLIIPSFEDWVLASRLVWKLIQEGEIHTNLAVALQNDALICVSAMSFSPVVPPVIVTDDTKHFRLIADYLNDRRKKDNGNLVIQSPKEYFKV